VPGTLHLLTLWILTAAPQRRCFLPPCVDDRCSGRSSDFVKGIKNWCWNWDPDLSSFSSFMELLLETAGQKVDPGFFLPSLPGLMDASFPPKSILSLNFAESRSTGKKVDV
jgi:hypothetical protein